MKLYFLVLLFLLPLSARAYQATPTKAPNPTLSELQTKTVQLSLKDYQIAQLQKNQAEAALNDAKNNVLGTVQTLKKELGLDDTWDFNFQTLQFVKKQVANTPPT